MNDKSHPPSYRRVVWSTSFKAELSIKRYILLMEKLYVFPRQVFTHVKWHFNASVACQVFEH